MSVDTWISIGTWVTAIATTAMAVAVIVTAVVAVRSLTATREDSRARTRPVIVATMKRERLSQGGVQLILTNFGPSVASHVQVTFSGAMPQDTEALTDADLWKWVYDRYRAPMPSWAPGWSLSNVIRSGSDELHEFTVTITYQGPDGSQYEDTYLLNPDHILNHTDVTPSKSEDPIKLEQQKLAALRALVRTLDSQ